MSQNKTVIITMVLIAIIAWFVDSMILRGALLITVILTAASNLQGDKFDRYRTLVGGLCVLMVGGTVALSLKIVLTEEEYMAVISRFNYVLWSKYMIVGLCITRITYILLQSVIDRMTGKQPN